MKLGRFELNAFALNKDVVAILTGPLYAVDAFVGSEPSSVYLMVAVASAHDMETVCADA